MKYIRNPRVVDAFQWTGDCDQTEDPEWAIQAIKDCLIYFDGPKTNPFLDEVVMRIKSKTGLLTAHRGDWIVRKETGDLTYYSNYFFISNFTLIGEHIPGFREGPGGSLVCNTAIEGITNKMEDMDLVNYYGDRYFVGESMSRKTMEVIAKALGGGI